MATKLEINVKNFPNLKLWEKWTIEANCSTFLIFMNTEGEYFHHVLLCEENEEEVIARMKINGNEFISSVPV